MVATALALAGCGGGGTAKEEEPPVRTTSVLVTWNPSDTGSALIGAVLVPAIPADVQSVVVTVTDAGSTVVASKSLTYVATAGRWEGTLDAIPVGVALTFTGGAYASTDGTGTVLFEGSSLPTTLTSSGPNQVILRLALVGTVEIVLPRLISYAIAVGDVTQDWVPPSTAATITVTVGGPAGEAIDWTIAAAANGGIFAPASGQVTPTAGDPLAPGTTDVYTKLIVTTYTAPSTVFTYTHSIELKVRGTNVATTPLPITVATSSGEIPPPIPPGSVSGIFTFLAPVVTSIEAQRTAINDLVLKANVATDAGRASVFPTWSYTPAAGTPSLAFQASNVNPAALLHYTPPANGTVGLTVNDGVQTSEVSFALPAGLFPDLTPPAPFRPVLLGLGASHTCTRLSWGQVACWGSNADGQVGDGTQTDRSAPVLVAGLPGGAVMVAAGSSHTCAALADGSAWCWGTNASGQLGIGVTSTRSIVPVRVCATHGGSACTSFLSDVKELGAGLGFTCARLGNGSVQCWGQRQFGKLGAGLGTAPGNQPLPVTVIGVTSAETLTVGVHHACARTLFGEVRCWGANGIGQLGNGLTSDSDVSVPASVSNAVVVSAGGGSTLAGYTCALINTATVSCWGDNSSGKLGNGTTTDSLTPVQVCAAGQTAGCSTFLTGVVALSVGDTSACAALTSGRVQCWGDNTIGQLGNGVSGDSLVPVDVYGIANAETVAVGDGHGCALLAGGAIRCWGVNTGGKLGFGIPSATTTSSRYPLAVDQVLW